MMPVWLLVLHTGVGPIHSVAVVQSAPVDPFGGGGNPFASSLGASGGPSWAKSGASFCVAPSGAASLASLGVEVEVEEQPDAVSIAKAAIHLKPERGTARG